MTSKGNARDKKIVKLQDCKGFGDDNIVRHNYYVNTNATIRARLQGGVCELCGYKGKSNYEVHHVSSVKDLEGNKHWEQIMKKRNRKTLVVCEECHKTIHS